MVHQDELGFNIHLIFQITTQSQSSTTHTVRGMLSLTSSSHPNDTSDAVVPKQRPMKQSQVFCRGTETHRRLWEGRDTGAAPACQGQGCHSPEQGTAGPVPAGCPAQKRWHWARGSPAHSHSHRTLTAGMAQFGLFWVRTSQRWGLVRGISVSLTQDKNSCCEAQKLQEKQGEKASNCQRTGLD